MSDKLHEALIKVRLKIEFAPLWEGIHIVDSPPRKPKGFQKVAGGRSPRRPPEKSLVMTAPRRGARRHVNVKDLYIEDLAPLRGATQLISHSRCSPRTAPTGYFLATLRVSEVSQLFSYLRQAKACRTSNCQT